MSHASKTAATRLERSLQQIAQLGQAGKLTEAVRQCQQVLQRHPQAAGAWHLLGLITLQQGQPQAALAHLEKAIALNPNRPEFYNHAGVAQCHAGDLEAGIVYYQQALALQPQSIDTRFNLALALQKLGRVDEALPIYIQLVAQQPTHAIGHYQLGVLYQQRQQLATAIDHYQQAIQLQPRYLEAWYNLGVAWHEQANFDRAVEAYQQALTLNPDYVEAHNGLGAIYEKRDQAAPALSHYQQALAIRPDYIPALINLANLWMRLERLTEAEALYRQVLEQNPAEIQALDGLVKLWLKTCSWSELATTASALKTLVFQRIQQGYPPGISPLNTLYLPFSAAEQQAIARAHAQMIARSAAPVPVPAFPPPDARLHIGYVSGDFRYHPVGQLIQRLFALHDRQQFQVFAYSLGPDDGSPERQTLIQDCDCFRDLRGLTPHACAEQIRQDGINILIDLAGYTDYGCPQLFALRPAPLQVSYLGYPATLGADYIDYVLTDPIVTPSDLAELMTEQCLYLPDCYQINTDRQPVPAVHATSSDRAQHRMQHGLPDQAFVFCCFNKSQKIEPEIFAVWMRILQQVPASVLWLLSDRPETESHLRAAAEAQGVRSDRLIFAPRLSKAEHLQRHPCADLFLDTLYYNAHVTASDALWCGVPLLTHLGQTFASRVAASLLTTIGLPDLITHSLDEYEQRAVQLATQSQMLQLLTQRLIQNRSRSPLFNPARTVRHLEAGYRLIWARHQANQPPQTTHIPSCSPPPAPAPSLPSSSPPPLCLPDAGFLQWLSQANGSLLITTYQANRVVLLGWNG